MRRSARTRSSPRLGHFRRLGDKQGDQSYAVRRFTDEVNRLYGVLNYRLHNHAWLAGDDITIADIITRVLEDDAAATRTLKLWFASRNQDTDRTALLRP